MKKLIIAVVAVGILLVTSNAYALKWINSYSRSDGTRVSGHYRSEPDGYKWNNLNYNG